MLAIKAAGKIEHEGLEQGRAVIRYRRAIAEARDTVMQGAVRPAQPNSINAGLQLGFRRQRHVGGRETECTAKLLPP